MPLRLAALACLLACLPGAGGCVSPAAHRDVARERDALRTRATELAVRSRALERRLEELGTDVLVWDARSGGPAAAHPELAETARALEAELARERAAGLAEVRLEREGVEVRFGVATLFEPGSVRLSARGRDLLGRVAAVLRGVPFPVVVAAHSDDLPVPAPLAADHPSAWDLTAAQAARAVALFETAGVPAARLAAVSLGPSRPRVPNDSAAGRLRNRRLEIRVRPLPPAAAETVPAAP